MTMWLFALFATWLLCGLVAALVMGRRGYDPWSWGVLGALLGPLVVPIAVARLRRDGETERVIQVGKASDSGIDVLVGVDGSPDARAATREVAHLLGDRLGTMTLANAIDFDAADASTAAGVTVFERDAQALLEAAAADVPSARPTMVVLEGRPADALASYATQHDIDLVVVGARGRGLSERLLGSVVEQLVRRPDLLVLVAGRDLARQRA